MISTAAKKDKTRPLGSIEEYVDYQIVDTEAQQSHPPFIIHHSV